MNERSNLRHGVCDSFHWLGETLWLRQGSRKRSRSRPTLIEKGVVCWLHRNRGLLLEKPIRMFGEGHEVPIRQTK